MNKWRQYSDLDANVIASDENGQHNTVTPLVRKKDQTWELTLILRNNHTTAEYPGGLFHPHSDVWPIKKENIGLIEAAGLAILPGRLMTQLKGIEQALIAVQPLPEDLAIHTEWVKTIDCSNPNARQAIEDTVTKVFVKGLLDCQVLPHPLVIQFLQGVINENTTNLN
jgi:UDPglucose--hexose-1-phosphate uridylyltransferase